jgi:hypothetical protein
MRKSENRKINRTPANNDSMSPVKANPRGFLNKPAIDKPNPEIQSTPPIFGNQHNRIARIESTKPAFPIPFVKRGGYGSILMDHSWRNSNASVRAQLPILYGILSNMEMRTNFRIPASGDKRSIMVCQMAISCM